MNTHPLTCFCPACLAELRREDESYEARREEPKPVVWWMEATDPCE